MTNLLTYVERPSLVPRLLGRARNFALHNAVAHDWLEEAFAA